MTTERQRGFILPAFLAGTTAKIVMILLIVSALAGIVYAVKSYIQTRDAALVKSGEERERTKWQERENKELADANAMILALTEKYRAIEGKHATELAGISGQYQEDLANAKTQRDRDVARALAGDLKLRFAGSRPACRESAGGSPAPSAVAPASGRDGAEVIELPGKTSADLFALVDDADEAVKQLTRAQDVIRAYYRACGPPA